MAMKIIASRNEGMKDGKNYLRAELIADSASDLSIEGMSNYHFTFGSIAYCIAEKSFYVLNSSGTWVSSSENSASTLSTTSLNRPSGLMSTKPITLSPDITESDTNDSEGITDDDTDDVEELPEGESNEVTEDVEPLRDSESK